MISTKCVPEGRFTKNRKVRVAALILPVFLTFSAMAADEIMAEGPEVDATKKLVVMIEDKPDYVRTQGAGIVFAVDDDWTFIVTAYHLVRHATALQVRFWQGQEAFPAELYKSVVEMDLAVLRVKARDGPFEFRRAADPELLKSGQPVHAIGHPQDETPWNFIRVAGAISQIDASDLKAQYPSIKPGYSGGPLIDEHGMIIGMVLDTDGTTALIRRIDRITQILSRDLHLTVELSPIPFSMLVVDDGSSHFRQVASNVPQYGNVWHSLAQTFTAPAEHVFLGFRLADTASSLPDAGKTIIYNLYAGENSYSKLLTSKKVNFPGTLSVNDARSSFGDVGFVLADFSDVDLTIGQSYTIEIKDLILPGVGSSSPIHVFTSSANPYPDGRFYFPPDSPGSRSNASLVRDDMLFEVVRRGGVATYELDMRLSDGGLVRGHFTFDSNAAMAPPSATSDPLSASLLDYNITVSGGNPSIFPELHYSPSNSVSSVSARDDGPGFPVFAFALSHKDAKFDGRLLAIRWTTPQVLPTTVGSEIRLTTWGWNDFGLSNQQCFDCYPQRQALNGSLRVTARKSGSSISK